MRWEMWNNLKHIRIWLRSYIISANKYLWIVYDCSVASYHKHTKRYNYRHGRVDEHAVITSYPQ